MNKRRRREAKRMRNAQRDNFITIASFPAAHILSIEDRRRFEPVDTFPKGKFHRSARLVVHPNKNNKSAAKGTVPSRVKFAVPREVAMCVRRKQRREILFAMRRTGKGSRAKRRRRTFYSNISC